MYALVDCNNFYASCERLFRPELNGQPIAVLSNNDGCVIARSNEAKKWVPMGAAAFEYQKIFDDHDIHVFSSNYALYGDISQRVMTTLATFSPEIEVYSIDEAFMKFIGFEKLDLLEYGQRIHKTVLKNIGIPISVGIAPTKALAKIANKIAKKFPEKTGNAYVIDGDEKRIKALKWTKIGDVWGIGHRNERKLLALNIKTAYDFTSMHDDWVRNNMTVVGLRLKHDLEGKSSIDFEEKKPKQNIATTRSFEKMISSRDGLRERVSTFAGSCAEKLRRENSHCNAIDVFLQSNVFRADLPQYSNYIRIKTDFPTNDTLELNRLALLALNIIYRPGIDYKKAGVIVGSITPAGSFQTKLFGGENPRHQDLMKVMDKLNRKIGQTKIRIGSQSLGRKWKMRQERLSQNYTTDWDSLITVNCR